MSDPPFTSGPYRVFDSGRVRDELERLVAQARTRGLAPHVLAAVKEIDRRFRVYPQFGQPLRDLNQRPLCLWLGCVPPLSVHYVLDEERRQVSVAVPLTPLPRSGL